MSDVVTSEIRALLDKQAITEILMRYSRATDRKDFQALREYVYWPDAADDHVLYVGDIPGLIEFNTKFTVDMPTTHFLGNILIEFQSGAHAFAETYYLAFHDMPGEGGRQDMMLIGRYL